MTDQPFDQAALDHYDEFGYAVVRDLFKPDQLAVWHQRFREIVSGAVPPAEGMLVMRDVMVAKGAVQVEAGEAQIAKVQDYEQDEVLFSYARDPALLAGVEQFVGPDIKSIHTMLINKPPEVDGRHPLHQDLLYFPFRPADRIVATWTALEACTRENGCLVVVPGSHKGKLLEHEQVDWEYVNYLYLGVKGVDGEVERVHLEMEPGETVFFHPKLIHGSGRNRTQGYRKAISAHFASAECRFLEGATPAAGRRPYTLIRGREHPDCI
jgi:phytanoyl-CoA hydroxylase